MRFHRSIYFPRAVAEAVAMFAEHGDLTIDDSGADYIEVGIVASDASAEYAVAGAFGNYVLGASVHAHQQQAG
jgi:hypothetical protein